jgi:hypothetical protein
MNNSKIDQRIKEIENEVVLLTDYMSEAVEKKLGVHIKALKESIDKLQMSGLDIGKGEIKLPNLTEDLSGLKSGIDNLIKLIESKEFQTKDDSLNLSIENNIGSIIEKLGSIDTGINESIKKTAENKDELQNTFIENIDKLKTLSENIQGLCTVDEKRTLGKEMGLISAHLEEISGEIVNLSEKSLKGITSVEEVLQNTEGTNAVKQEELKNALLENINNLRTSIDEILQLCKTDDKQLGTEISLIGNKIENVTKEFPNFSSAIQQEVSQLNSEVHKSVEQAAKQQLEMRDSLLREIKNINENAEVIRRMCSTDQEKFLGSMTTVVYNKVNDLSEAMNNLQEKVKNWIFTLDKNIRIISNQTESKQEEMKKIILYDINKLNDDTEILKNCCKTEENRPLGGEMITVSNRVGKMFEESPLILEKVISINERLDSVSAEVIRMRWFVLGAVGISLIVLIASFF